MDGFKKVIADWIISNNVRAMYCNSTHTLMLGLLPIKTTPSCSSGADESLCLATTKGKDEM